MVRLIQYVCVILITGLATCAGFAESGSGIQVTPMILRISASQKVGDIKVKNMGNTVQYIQTIPSLIKQGGAKTKSKHIVFDPAKETPEQFGLLVTPRKLVLRAHQTRVLRVVSLHNNVAKDEYYSVKVVPVQNALEQIYGQKKQAIEAALQIIVAYEPLVIITPSLPKVDVAYERKGKVLSMANKGNTYVTFENARQCSPQGSQCQKLQLETLYYGQSRDIKLPYNAPVTFSAISVNGSKTVSLN